MAALTIHGNIGRDPELRHAGSSVVLSFSVADKQFIPSKGGDSPAQWYNVEVWGKQAERLESMLAKGSGVVVSGQLVQRPYATTGGEQRISMDLKAYDVQFAGKKPEGGGYGSSGGGGSNDDFGVPF